MTREEHRARHIELHRAFDELVADWLNHNLTRDCHLSNTSIMDLMKWSHQQTIEPTEPKS